MLSFYKYPGDDVPVIKGSALCALEGHDDNIGKEKVLELMKTVDEYFPLVCNKNKDKDKNNPDNHSLTHSLTHSSSLIA